MLCYTSKRSRVQRLHQECAHSPNERAEVAMDDPRSGTRFEEASGVASADSFKPRWNTLGVAREESSKLDREELLDSIVS